jgi:hypothetical protein
MRSKIFLKLTTIASGVNPAEKVYICPKINDGMSIKFGS